MISQISNIQFGILSDEDIVNMSVCEINKTTLSVEEGSVYDPRLGCVENSGKCETCNENIYNCTGHFGHISLRTPIIIYYKQVVNFLKIFCLVCHRLLCTKEELKLLGALSYDKIFDVIKTKISHCGRCSNPHPEIRIDMNTNVISAQHKFKDKKTCRILNISDIKIIFDNILDEDVELLKIDVNMFRPRNLILTKFPVIPICCRPRMIIPDNISDDDLSLSLIEIIKYNNLLGTNLSKENYDKAVSIIKFKTLTYCDNSKGKAVHNTNHKPMSGIKERICKKSGIIRQNNMGKRNDGTARTVLGPDSTLKLNEVAIPKEIANTLTKTVYVNQYNINELTKLVNTPGKASVIVKKNKKTGKEIRISVPTALCKINTYLNHGDVILRDGKKIIITDCKFIIEKDDIIMRYCNDVKEIIPTKLPEIKELKLEIGDKVERHLIDGDFVLLNRQPTLHRNSMQGMKIVIKPGKTIRLNLAIVTGYNADFDGDEGNIFIQETLESEAELKYLSNAKYNILSAQSNKPEMVIVQDSLLGAYKMTYKIQQMEKEDFMNCLFRVQHDYNFHERLNQIRNVRNEHTIYTTHALFGFLFPPDFHIEYKNLKIEYGIIISGYFDKSILKGDKKSLIRILCMEYDEDITCRFIDNIQFITNAWLEINAFSIGIKDCLIDQEKQKQIKHTIYKYFLEATNVSRSIYNKDIKESKINCSLNKAKDIGLKIAKESLKEDNNFISTVKSGSRGDYFNISQITGLLGQQNLDGCRIEELLDNGNRTLIHYPRNIKNTNNKYKSKGFISSSFINGMKPDEMFFHAMSGREGMIKTAMGTATSGYVQRSIIKLNEDIKIEYDGTVRDAKKNIYQYSFGNHGFDPSKVNINESKNEVYPINISRLAKRLNCNENNKELLNENEINEIIEKCKFNRRIPKEINYKIQEKQNNLLRNKLSKIKLSKNKFDCNAIIFFINKWL